MKQAAKKWGLFGLRWGIAIVGIWWVVSKISFDDENVVMDANQQLVAVQVVRDVPETGAVLVREEASGVEREVQRSQVQTRPGVRSLVNGADAKLLAGAVLVFPIVFVITAYRWNRLLAALDIHLTQARTFTLSMVGAFYNTFMPGSTGGDVLKAYYASKQTHHRTRAVLSVVIDRILGLISLIVIGGVMASVQYFNAKDAGDPVARACLRIAVGSALLIALSVVGAIVMHRRVRKAVGLEYLLKRLPMQKQVRNAISVVDICLSRIGLMLWSIAVTFPVHITVVVSAMLAGMAFDLPLPAGYYFVAVPVIVLSGAIPISPQGAGVMEIFAIQLTKQYGTTVSQAVALTMSIRIVQIFWSLLGGIFVLRGGFHAPTRKEQEELARGDDEQAPKGEAPKREEATARVD
jgi:uncharacterized protein (TIRG00374 family)